MNITFNKALPQWSLQWDMMRLLRNRNGLCIRWKSVKSWTYGKEKLSLSDNVYGENKMKIELNKNFKNIIYYKIRVKMGIKFDKRQYSYTWKNYLSL